jgi:murein endopeptidase
MSWLRDEIWFDVDVSWSREAAAGSQAGVAALQLPLYLRLASEVFEPVHAPNGLSASRQRRAERRRRRHARRARAAALVVAPAAMLPLAGQKLGLGGSGSDVLQQDPPSLVGGTLPGIAAGEVSAPRAAGAANGSAAGGKTSKASSETDVPRIHWHRATSHGLPYDGSLSSGTQLPVEGTDWVTWNPVEDSVPNAPSRLYGHERTIHRLTAVLAAFRAANPDAARVVVGDISFRGGGQMEQHVSHQNGLDVDVYYPRLDRKLRAPRARSQVDLELSQDLVDRFVAAGARFVFVGYSTGLRGPSRVVEPYPNHGDHMHVRFPPPPG